MQDDQQTCLARLAPDRPIRRISRSKLQQATLIITVDLGQNPVSPIDEQILVEDPLDLHDQFLLALLPCRRFTVLRDVIGVWGDPDAVLTKHNADRLDLERVAVFID